MVYDLPILAGILAAGGAENPAGRAGLRLPGELSLSGPCGRGGHAAHGPGRPGAGRQKLFVPATPPPRPPLAGGPEIYPVDDVGQLAATSSEREPIWTAPAGRAAGAGRPAPISPR